MNKLFPIALLIQLLFSTVSAQTLSKEPTSNSLIVYNGNIALVHENRDLTLKKEDSNIIYKGVASTIVTDSVNVKLPDSVKLMSQQYRFDKLTRNKLLDAYIEKEVKVKLLKDAKSYRYIKATLLSNNGNVSIVRTKKGEILSVDSSDIIFHKLPKELITKPSLVWNISAKEDVDSNIQIDYLINNVNWQSDYILNLHGDTADLSGWITIDNRCGKMFKDTKLYVLAGDVNRVHKPQTRYVAKAMMAESSNVTQQSFEGYHIYSVPFKVDLANNEKTQIKFISKKNIKVKKRYSVMLLNPIYIHGENVYDVSQYVDMKGLDTPLPKGIVRSYSKLNDTNIFLGESSIKHTPKNTNISLNIGKDFDTKVTQTLLKRADTKNYYDVSVNYLLKNSSKETKTIELLIPFNRQKSSSVSSSKKYEFTKGDLVTFKLTLKPDSSESFSVNYRAKK